MLVKKLLALTLCLVTKADKVDDALNGLVNRANDLKNDAEGYKRSHGGARNDLAAEAAHDFYNRARAKTTMARSDLLKAIWNDYKHHENWEGKFRNWGGHRNGYAENVHKKAKDAFYTTHRSVNSMMSSLAYDPVVRLELIFSNQGGSNAKITKKIITGSQQSSSINKQLASTITARVKGPIGALTGSMSASASAAIQTSFSQSSYEHKEDTIELWLNKPIYIYQVVGHFMTGAGEALTINGNFRIFSEPVKSVSTPSTTNCYLAGSTDTYYGDISKTTSGKTCQRWDSDAVHERNMGAVPPASDRNHNYCRNPSSSGTSKPWCYTTDPNERWDYCDVPTCGKPVCYVAGSTDMYYGKLATTVSGNTCQRWDSDTYHKRNQGELPHSNDRNHNHCRASGDEERPWCYTTNKNVRWEYCDVPRC